MNAQRGVVGSKVRKGFTLVELLVVIAIIALLLAILMPALAKVKKQADSVVCRTHFKEIGTLISLYAYDNNGKMVSSSGFGRNWWYGLGDYYFKNHNHAVLQTSTPSAREDIPVFHCPNEWKKHYAGIKQMKTNTYWGQFNGLTGGAFLYAYNSFFMCRVEGLDTTPDDPSDDYAVPTCLARVKQPSTLPLFHDNNTDLPKTPPLGQSTNPAGYPHWTMYYEAKWCGGTTGRTATKYNTGGPAPNHGRGINYLFADGHAANAGFWPYDLKTNGLVSNTAMSITSPGTSDDYWTYFHPLRKLYQNGSGGARTVGDGWPPSGMPVH